MMQRLLMSTAALTMIAGFAGGALAEPGGCLKYGAGGAVAGHFVGKGHSVLGATGGCAVGAYKRHESRKAEQESMRSDQHRQNALDEPHPNQ